MSKRLVVHGGVWYRKLLEQLIREIATDAAREAVVKWPEWMNTTTAAKYLDMDEATLRRWRREGRGPTYSKGQRAVRYNRDDLDEHMASLKGGR